MTSGQTRTTRARGPFTTPSSSARGHDGLTAAAYLARAGLSTLMLEPREIVGGCCVTEEIATTT